MRKILLLLLVCWCQPNVAAQEPAACNNLTIGGPAEYPPLSFREDGEMKGVGFDVALEIGARLGVGIRIVDLGSWKRVLRMHENGEVDILVSLYDTPERRDAMTFLGAYWQERTVVVTRRDKSFPYNGWADLKPFRGVTIGGDSRGRAFDRFMKRELEMVYAPMQSNVMAMLQAGRVDYAVLGEYSFFTTDFDGPNSSFVMAPTPVDIHDIHMTMSKKSRCRDLAEPFSSALKAMRDDGSVARIFAAYRQR